PMAVSTGKTFAQSLWPIRALRFLVSFAMSLALHDLEAHRAGAAFDDPGRRLNRVGVQILHLLFGDLGDLRAADGAGRNLARLGRARLQLRRLLQKERSRRRLGGER